MTHAALMSAASRALSGGQLAEQMQEGERNAFPDKSAGVTTPPHGYADVRMPYAPQVAARTSPGVVPMKVA